MASLLTLPIVAGGLYLWLGSPELAQSAVQRNAAARQSVESLVARVEAHLAQNPEDGRGWEILAPVYMRLDRYSDAVTAWRNTLQLLGENAERDANLGEALTAEANGVVTAEAKADFVRAASLDKTLVSARYYLGLAAEQDGRKEEAAKIWRDLIAEAPPGAQWLSDVRNALAGVENNATQPSGPSAAQIAAAANQPAEQQSAMIQSMVDRLAARLKQDGSDVDGWVRLIRAYNVLGQAEKASAATTDAQQALAGAPDKLAQLNAALKGGDADHAAAAAPTPASGPNVAQTGTGADQPPPQHDIQAMVDRLAARLKQDGSDVAGWLQLIRSYDVMGQADKARAATADARQALASDPSKLEQFNAAREGGGGTGPGTAPANATPVPKASAPPEPPASCDDAKHGRPACRTAENIRIGSGRLADAGAVLCHAGRKGQSDGSHQRRPPCPHRRSRQARTVQQGACELQYRRIADGGGAKPRSRSDLNVGARKNLTACRLLVDARWRKRIVTVS